MRLPEFLDNRHMKVIRLSALRTGRLYPTRNPCNSFLLQADSTARQLSGAGRIKSAKYSTYPIRNQTRGLPGCSAVPQPTAPPRTPSQSPDCNQSCDFPITKHLSYPPHLDCLYVRSKGKSGFAISFTYRVHVTGAILMHCVKCRCDFWLPPKCKFLLSTGTLRTVA
jgi:hypothetical protein